MAAHIFNVFIPSQLSDLFHAHFIGISGIDIELLCDECLMNDHYLDEENTDTQCRKKYLGL